MIDAVSSLLFSSLPVLMGRCPKGGEVRLTDRKGREHYDAGLQGPDWSAIPRKVPKTRFKMSEAYLMLAG